MAHLTCLNNTKEQIREVLRDFKEHGIENILALRGDKNPDFEPKTDFKHASDLIAFIKEDCGEGFGISGACYPEVHMEAAGEVEDILNLRKKIDAGAQHIITQLFLTMPAFTGSASAARLPGLQCRLRPALCR